MFDYRDDRERNRYRDEDRWDENRRRIREYESRGDDAWDRSGIRDERRFGNDARRMGSDFGRLGMDYDRDRWGNRGREYGRDYEPRDDRFERDRARPEWEFGWERRGRDLRSDPSFRREGEYGYGRRDDYLREGPYVGRGPRHYRRSDERIREDVCDRLTEHGDVDASDLDIKVQDGVVTLEGTVDNRRMKRLAEDMADSVTGVREVNNQVRVHQEGQSDSGRFQGAGMTFGSEPSRTHQTGVS